MSPNAVSSAPLPWSLWLLFFLTPVHAQTPSSIATSEAHPPLNATLLFDSGHNLRNCSCSSRVQECDEALANSLCRCHTVPRSALPPAGLREAGRLTVWVSELWVLEELLNGSLVGHLRLAFCGVKPVDSQYLALLGLRTLRIHSGAPEAPYPDQEITISPSSGLVAEIEAVSIDFSSAVHVTILDVAVLNGLSALKAYTVLGPPAHTIAQDFPNLALPLVLPSSAPPEDPLDPSEHAAENLLVTFVY